MSVTLDRFTIQYGSMTALDHVTTTFPKGATGLLGANGAGKSSLIKGLLGLVPAADGSARILDKDIFSNPKWVRSQTGYMPEDDCLIPGLTGLEMVRYMGELSGMPGRDAMQRAHEVLYIVGLNEARYRTVETYSTGMKQRIKLAQAIVHSPQLLFLDEPTSGMDPKGRQDILDLILDIAARGDLSIVMATHILTDVERTCSKIVILDRGRLMEDARLDDLKGRFLNAYHIRLDGNVVQFEKSLLKAGCKMESLGKQTWDVVLPHGQNVSLLFQTAQDTGAVIRKMVPSVQTLEDVFVKKLKENASAHL